MELNEHDQLPLEDQRGVPWREISPTKTRVESLKMNRCCRWERLLQVQEATCWRHRVVVEGALCFTRAWYGCTQGIETQEEVNWKGRQSGIRRVMQYKPFMLLVMGSP